MNLNIRKDIIVNIAIILFAFWAYFLFSIGNSLIVFSMPWLILILLLLCITLGSSLKIRRINIVNILFLSYLIFSLLNTIKYQDYFMAIRFCFYYFYGIFLFNLLSSNIRWVKICMKIFVIFSLVYALFTIYSFFFPDSYYKIAELYFTQKQFNVIKSLMNTNGYSGLAGQTGNNGFMMSIGIGIIFCSLHFNKEKKYKIKMILLSVILLAVLLTAKRSFLIINAVICLGYCLNKVNLKNIIKHLLLGSFILLTVISVIVFMNTQKEVNVFNTIFDFSGDISSGRFDLYKEAWRQFGMSPIIGNGIQSFKILSNIISPSGGTLETHNIYFQLLCETGILGLVGFISILYFNLTKVITLRRYEVIEKKYKVILTTSLYIQILFILYGMFGNPMNDVQMLFIYFVFSAIPFGLESDLKILGGN